MKLKILYLILFILIFIPIGLCEIIKDDINLNNTKIYDKNDKIIFIYDKNNEKSMDIKLISTISDIDKLIKIIEVTNYIEFMPNKENDFFTKTKKIYGKNDVYKTEYFIKKYNYTFENIIINKTIFNNKTGKNETKLINKTIIKNIKSFWVEFKPYNKTIFKNERFKLKIIHYKKPELGFFKIQTIPIFKNIECKEFTWWNGNWNLKRPILINNTNGDNVINYQLKSVNLSQYEINASSARIINETSGLQQNFWNELIDSNGNLEYVWCNFSEILNNTWINETYYIYYQSNPNVNTISNGNLTFLFFENFELYNIGDLNNQGGWNGNINFDVSTVRPKFGIKGVKIQQITTDAIILKDSLSFGSTYALRFFVNIDAIDGRIVFCEKEGVTTLAKIFFRNLNKDGNSDIAFNNIDTTVNWEANIWYEIELIKHSNGNYDVWVNGVEKLTNKSPIVIGSTNTIYLLHYWEGSASHYIDTFIVRKYTINEPELWTVGNIEYPEGLNMTCNLEIITHLTEKEIKIINMTGDIVNISKTNECINLSYDSYIVYMSNPVKIDSMTSLLNILDNILVQFLLFIFLVIIATLFYVFIQIVKKKGFKGVIK